MSREFRVLIVDDKKDCLIHAEHIIPAEYLTTKNKWSISINPAHIKVVLNGGEYHIDEKSLENIARLSSRPFDLLLLDFGYRAEGSDAFLNELYDRCGGIVDIDEFEKYVLNPKVLVKEVVQYLSNLPCTDLLDSFITNFKGHKNKICVYTFHSENDRKHFPTVMGYCERIVRETFKDTEQIVVKDTRQDIFSGSRFAEIKNTHPEYYAFILTKYFEQLIMLQIANKELAEIKQLKNSKIPMLFRWVICINFLLGIGSTILAQLISGLWAANAIVFAALCIVLGVAGATGGIELLSRWVESQLLKSLDGE